MKILVINTGSSSIKYRLFDMQDKTVIAAGLLERIGEGQSRLSHSLIKKSEKLIREEPVADHQSGMTLILNLLTDTEIGVIKDTSEINAVGHRVVHGGEAFHNPVLIDEQVLKAIKDNALLAPLHNPPNLSGIDAARKFLPKTPQVAVFDTAFHQSIPPKAFHYGLPHDLYKEHHIRRYGFHGTSHHYVAKQAAEYLGKTLGEVNLITIHLGNGSSITAIQKGQSVDTSMGMTPLEGLLMGTRSGDLDPSIHLYLAKYLDMSVQEVVSFLNEKSGLLGLCGTNDMREILDKMGRGDELASLAFEIYAYRVKKYIGAYYAVLGMVDALVFTGGIGENVPELRELACQGMERLGIIVDPAKNKNLAVETLEISSDKSQVKVLVIPTNEELEIALQTAGIVK